MSEQKLMIGSASGGKLVEFKATVDCVVDRGPAGSTRKMRPGHATECNYEAGKTYTFRVEEEQELRVMAHRRSDDAALLLRKGVEVIESDPPPDPQP